ncbi:hypothetical protein BASA82_000494 [Batrachochytrium salamandrivorans]|nr:hypothetical protein BASA81_003451 [Batrachochytrium salamandrivorans]KAH9262448.1 hypothetical protein BASA82_000494 [Batrachochytrium salamandrivorans]
MAQQQAGGESELENQMNELNAGAKEVVLKFTSRTQSASVIALWQALQTSTTESVNLYAHREYGQIASLCQALTMNRSLRVLDLENVGLGDEGTRLVGLALERNQTLYSLNLSGNQVGRLGAQYLATALQSNHTLRELNLWDNSLGNAGAEELAKGVAVNHDLVYLNLCKNEITNQGAQHLVLAIKQTYSIKTINLTKQYVSRKVMLDLKLDIYHVQSVLGILSAQTVPRLGPLSLCRQFPGELVRMLYAFLKQQ